MSLFTVMWTPISAAALLPEDPAAPWSTRLPAISMSGPPHSMSRESDLPTRAAGEQHEAGRERGDALLAPADDDGSGGAREEVGAALGADGLRRRKAEEVEAAAAAVGVVADAPAAQADDDQGEAEQQRDCWQD